MKRLAAWGLCLLVACTPRPRQDNAPDQEPVPGPKDRRVVEIDLASGAPETTGPGLFQLPATRTYAGLVRSLERAVDDPLTAAVFVRLENEKLDYARAEELGALLARFRDKKLPVVCHAHEYSNASSWLVARGCTRIWLSAAGNVDTVGIAAELVYLKGLLDKLKIGVDFLSMGKYKGGAEPLLREGPSEATIESFSSTFGSIREAWLSGAEQGRPGQGIREKLEQGPYSPSEAKAAGLVDAIGFDSQALAEARRLGKTELVGVRFGPRSEQGSGFDFGELVRLLSGADGDSSGRPRLVVVPAEGAIGMEAGGPLDSGGITAKSLNRTLKRLRQDDSVKAVVLRIDSPGGSPLASDLIWHELMELRKKKIVVASVGGMAASGGYYIAAGANRIVAERTSIVGSIGVFGGKIVIGPALQELGINSFSIPASPHPGAAERAAYLSPFKAWDDATRDRVRSNMQSIYDLFIARIVEGRRMPEQAVRASAEGRIWSGDQGKERGLVDELGGLSKALDVARKLSGLERDIPVTVEGPRESLLEQLFLSEGASESQIREALTRFEQEHAFLRELPAALRVHAGTLAALHDEHVLVALPMAIVLR